MSLFLFVDITLVQESEKAKLESKFKHIYLSSVSHNLKTPLNSKNHESLPPLLGLVLSHDILDKRITYRDRISKSLIKKNK
jgi:hypothetical protein